MGGWPVLYYQDARLVLKAYTLRQRKQTFDGINGVTQTLVKVSAVHTLRHLAAARRRAVETWLQRNEAINITQDQKCYPFSRKNCSQ